MCTIPSPLSTGREALAQAGVHMESVVFCQSPYEVAEGADALVIVTEWNEFTSLNMHQIKHAMHHPILIDGRNIYEASEMKRLGFTYRGIGRGTGPDPSVLPSGDSSSTQPLLSGKEG